MGDIEGQVGDVEIHPALLLVEGEIGAIEDDVAAGGKVIEENARIIGNESVGDSKHLVGV